MKSLPMYYPYKGNKYHSCSKIGQLKQKFNKRQPGMLHQQDNLHQYLTPFSFKSTINGLTDLYVEKPNEADLSYSCCYCFDRLSRHYFPNFKFISYFQ